jgi:hypothetical protein
MIPLRYNVVDCQTRRRLYDIPINAYDAQRLLVREFEGLTAIVAKGAAEGETWRVTKSKCFAFQVERQSIDVSHLDWFPAIAVWDRNNRPIRRIRNKRAADVNARMLSPKTVKEWQTGNACGDWNFVEILRWKVSEMLA